MLRAKRRSLASILAFTITITGSAQALAWQPEEDRPGEIAMIGDIAIARPVMLASTVIGLVLFTATLPISIMGGNEDEAAEKLVAEPAEATFMRCLGCTPAQNERRRAERRTQKINEAKEDN